MRTNRWGHGSSVVVLYDSGRLPLWIRMPAVVGGFVCLYFGVAIAAEGYFGVTLERPESPLLGSLVCFAIGALWTFTWFAQLWILFDPVQQDLIVRTRGYFRYHDHHISLTHCREIQVRQRNSSGWEVTAEFSEGRSKDVATILSGVEVLVASLETATKLPIRRYEDER